MFKNLKAEMFRKDVSIKQISGALGISERTLRNKINGATNFTWKEVCEIQERFFPNNTKEYLFTKTAQEEKKKWK